jgi:hypothetical protein
VPSHHLNSHANFLAGVNLMQAPQRPHL